MRKGKSNIVSASNAVFGSDPLPGVQKILLIEVLKKLQEQANNVIECLEGCRVRVLGGSENVVRAWYGHPDHRWMEDLGYGRFCTEEVLVQMNKKGNGIIIASNRQLGGDPVPCVKKVLLVEVGEDRLDVLNKPQKEADNVIKCLEGYRVCVPGGFDNVVRAWYGDPEHQWIEGTGHGKLCTKEVFMQMTKKGNGIVVASNRQLGGDPAPCVEKVLLVEVREGGGSTVELDEKPHLYKSPQAVPSAPCWVAFIRHAQAGHNVCNSLLTNPDNPLTDFGVSQVKKARIGAAGKALHDAELVVSSPLMRALQTCFWLFGSDSSSIRVRVDAAITERWSAPCDEGTLKSELLDKLPKQCSDWEGWDDLPERWWPEEGEDPWVRVEAFVESLRKRPEARIAFVGHGAFWHMTLGHSFENCEVVFCDRFLF